MSKFNSNSLVSIIITTYNHARYIAYAINSALAQTYNNVEIIVIDDGSTDNTRDIVSEYKNIHYYYQKNQGLPAARNCGIKKAKGEFISFLDADDFLFPNGIETNISYLLCDKSIAFVSGAYINVDEFGNETEESSIRIEGNNFHHLIVDNYIGNPGTVLFRRNIIEKYLFDTNLKCVEDYDVYLRISKDFEIVNHEKFIAAYRRLSNSMSSNIPLMLYTVIKVKKNIIKYFKQDIRLNALWNIGIKKATDYFVNIAKIQIFDTNIGSKMKFDRWSKTVLLILRHRPILIIKVIGKKIYFGLCKRIKLLFANTIITKYNFKNKKHSIYFLVYNKINSPVINLFDTNVSETNFKSHIKYLKKLDCILKTDQLLEFINGKKNLERDYIYLIFNYGYENSLLTATELLNSFELPGNFIINKNILTENTKFYWWDVLESIFLIQKKLPEKLNLVIDEQYFTFDFYDENISESIDIESCLWKINFESVNKRTKAFKNVFQLLLKASTTSRNKVIDQLIEWSNFDLENFKFNKLISYNVLKDNNKNKYLDILFFEPSLNLISNRSEIKSTNSEINSNNFKNIKGNELCEKIFNSFNNEDCSIFLNKVSHFDNEIAGNFKILMLNITNQSKNELNNTLLNLGYVI